MQAITDFINQHPTAWQAARLIFTAVATIVIVVFVLKLERKAAKRLMAQKKNINLRFVENIGRFVLILLAIEFVVMSSPLTRSFGKVLFQGTAIVGAIAGFAAQPVIADIICGLMMSATKPFDIGDRIELEDGSSGIVKDITLRHVVLQGIDTMKIVIPNSKLNGMRITNMSFHSVLRSLHFRFNVAYDTDVELAKEVIARAVRECPHAVTGKPGKNGNEYGPVYFIEYADSSLVMATTVWYEQGTPTEVVRSDINTRVLNALRANGIEIPYDTVNVMLRDKEQKQEQA